MKKLVSGITGTQEMFELEPRLVVSREYNAEEAEAMAKHRQKRIGQLALTEPTKGFRYAVGGLWIPHSQTENMAVVRYPHKFMKQSAELIKDKVFEKYTDEEGNRTRSIAQLAIWSQFDEDSERRNLTNKYESWRVDARDKYRALNPGLHFNGTVWRKEAEEHPAVMQSMASYLADLKSYVGHPDMIHGFNKRVWMQDGHVKKQAEHLKWSKDFLSTQPDWEFDRWFAESWYNHRSRAKFWHEVTRSSYEMSEDIAVQKRINAWREDMEYRGYILD